MTYIDGLNQVRYKYSQKQNRKTREKIIRTRCFVFICYGCSKTITPLYFGRLTFVPNIKLKPLDLIDKTQRFLSDFGLFSAGKQSNKVLSDIREIKTYTL